MDQNVNRYRMDIHDDDPREYRPFPGDRSFKNRSYTRLRNRMERWGGAAYDLPEAIDFKERFKVYKQFLPESFEAAYEWVRSFLLQSK